MGKQRVKAQEQQIVFLDDLDNVHTVYPSPGDTVRAVRYEIAQRPKGGEKDWMLIGILGSYYAAKRSDLPHSDLEFEEWMDQVANLEADDEDLTLTRDRFLMLVDEGRVTTSESFDELFINKETDLGEEETTPLSS